MRISFLTTFRFLVCLAASLLSQIAFAGDCGCNAACSSRYGAASCTGGSLSACMAICENNEKLGRDTGDLNKYLVDQSRTLIPAFKAAREKLWNTAPNSSEFRAVFDKYKNLRKEKDNALLMEYGSLGLSPLITGGAPFAPLDEKYLVPQKARQAFHDYAMEQLKSLVNAGPNAFGGARRDGYARMDEAMGGKGSYYGCVKIADQEELNMYGTRNPGAASGHMGMGGQVLDYDPIRMGKCVPRTLKAVPNQWADSAQQRMNPEFEKALTACLRAKD